MSARGTQGFTMLEVLVASIVGALIAGGTMMAFVTAARISRNETGPDSAEASAYARETLERLRNDVAADPSPSWFQANAGLGWQPDTIPLPPAPGDCPTAGKNQSILCRGPVTRRYKVTAEDCDGVGGTGDCYAVSVKVCWDDPAC